MTMLVAEGLSAAQIAARTGYSIAGVYKRRRRVGLTVKRTEDQAVLSEVRRLHEEGNSANQVGRLLGHGERWVIERLRAEGVPLRVRLPGGRSVPLRGRLLGPTSARRGCPVVARAVRFGR